MAFALSSVLPGVSYDRGMALADRIHTTGQALVWSGHREQAEPLLGPARGARADHGAARAVAGSRGEGRGSVLRVPLALTGYETLLASAAVFIAFALVVALVVPARDRVLARRLGWFVAVCIALFAVQTARSSRSPRLGEEEEPAEAAPAVETLPVEPEETDTTGGPTTTETTTAETTTETTETTEGEAIRLPARRSSSLSRSPRAVAATRSRMRARRRGRPDLDAASPSYDKVVERVTNGRGAMPSFADTLSEQIQDVAAYVSSVAGGSSRGARGYAVPPGEVSSGRRSATGNRVRAERCVAGSNPALSVSESSGRPAGSDPAGGGPG